MEASVGVSKTEVEGPQQATELTVEHGAPSIVVPDDISLFFMYRAFLLLMMIVDAVTSFLAYTAYGWVLIIFGFIFLWHFEFWELVVYLVYRCGSSLFWLFCSFDAVFRFTVHEFQWQIVLVTLGVTAVTISYTLFVFHIAKVLRELLKKYTPAEIRKYYNGA